MLWPILGSRTAEEQNGTAGGIIRCVAVDLNDRYLPRPDLAVGGDEKDIMQRTMPGARRRGRPRTAWMDNIKTWTGLPVEESIRATEDGDKWRKYVHGVANPRIEDG